MGQHRLKRKWPHVHLRIAKKVSKPEKPILLLARKNLYLHLQGHGHSGKLVLFAYHPQKLLAAGHFPIWDSLLWKDFLFSPLAMIY
ncbi:hypothetical protein ADN00_18950 [Ornatilinea apprima]|uniref:Uncharacterized protein n=1 Tax=Ornatilinea apprima TaxID=1134406 RepID=A0A0P6WMT3_9CHLR|nr:hypothetical protein ADN00_18950 [Ornatilinea apprima]